MGVPATLGGLSSEIAYLRVLYDLAGGQAMRAVFYGDVSRELDWPPDRADEVAFFWVDRGVLEWTNFGNLVLTHLGLKRAARLASHGWSLAST